MIYNISKKLLLFVVAAGLIFSSCDDAGGVSSKDGSMSAKVDGAKWAATKVTGSPLPAAYATYTVSGTMAYLQIIGTQMSGTSASTISISLYNVKTTGEYKVGLYSGSGDQVGIAVIGYSDGKAYTTTGQTEFIGTVKITEFDEATKTIKGTFTFTGSGQSGGATGKQVVTDGQFNVNWGVI
jgi:hypothetical protein